MNDNNKITPNEAATFFSIMSQSTTLAAVVDTRDDNLAAYCAELGVAIDMDIQLMLLDNHDLMMQMSLYQDGGTLAWLWLEDAGDMQSLKEVVQCLDPPNALQSRLMTPSKVL
jgi:hypothetical protein